MTVKVLECCPGKTTNHMGYGRCSSLQGGRTAELKVEFSEGAQKIALSPTQTILGFVLDPCEAAMSCVNMVDCIASTDPCGEQIEKGQYAIRHLLEDPCDPTRIILQLCGPDGPVTELPEPYCVWLRVYGA